MPMITNFEKTIYTWKIENFIETIEKENELFSPYFPSEGNTETDWKIVLQSSRTVLCRSCLSYRNLVCDGCHRQVYQGEISIHLSYLTINANLPPLKVKYILQNAVTKKHHKKSVIFCTQSANCLNSGILNFITLNDIKEFIVDNDLTIKCCIKQAFKNAPTGFESFMIKTSLSDVELHVGDQVFPAHKVVLSAKSPVFRQMFSHQLEENISNIVKIVDIDSKVFYEILYFIYSGKVRKLNEFAYSLLVAADKYDIDSLKTICENYLEKNLTNENVMKMLKLADDLRAYDLKKSCLSFIIFNLDKVVATEEFKTLAPDHYMHLLLQIVEKCQEYSWSTKKLDETCDSMDQAVVQQNDGFETYLNQEIWSDVEIHNRGKTYHVHKLVLSAKSVVFKNMLVELEGQATIEVNDIDPIVFYELLHFIYTGFVNNLEDMTYELLLAADKYQIPSLKLVCERALILKVNIDNVVSMLKIAENRKADTLKKQSIVFLIKKVVSGTLGLDVFKQLSKSHPQLVLEVLITAGLKCEIED